MVSRTWNDPRQWANLLRFVSYGLICTSDTILLSKISKALKSDSGPEECISTNRLRRWRCLMEHLKDIILWQILLFCHCQEERLDHLYVPSTNPIRALPHNKSLTHISVVKQNNKLPNPRNCTEQKFSLHYLDGWQLHPHNYLHQHSIYFVKMEVSLINLKMEAIVYHFPNQIIWVPCHKLYLLISYSACFSKVRSLPAIQGVVATTLLLPVKN